MPLPVVPLDSPNEKQHRTVIATSLNELVKFFNTIKSTTSWTPVIRGSGTAGTYEIASSTSTYSRIGRWVKLDFFITMAAAVTGGGTGYMQITGAPYTKAAGTFPIGSVYTSGLNFAAASPSLSLQFIAATATSTLFIHENVDNSAGNDFPVSGVAANNMLAGSILYETDDP
jgi:hypothetical protein